MNAVEKKYTHNGQDVVLDDVNNAVSTYQNGLGSTVGTANTAGGKRDTQTYDSYGNSQVSNYRTRYQFTGRERDGFTGLQFSCARFCDPAIGKFISEDPIGFGGGGRNLKRIGSGLRFIFRAVGRRIVRGRCLRGGGRSFR